MKILDAESKKIEVNLRKARIIGELSAEKKIKIASVEVLKQSAFAESKYLRIPPRKARLAADLIRGKAVDYATFQLKNCQMKGGRLLLKTLESAIQNAETLLQAPNKNLKVVEVRVDAGPVLKRAKSKSRGGRAPVMKRTSHFIVVVGTAG